MRTSGHGGFLACVGDPQAVQDEVLVWELALLSSVALGRPAPLPLAVEASSPSTCSRFGLKGNSETQPRAPSLAAQPLNF